MKYKIDETTKDERMKLVYKALGISMSDAEKPSEETMQIINQYIDGVKELEDVQKEIIEMHKKKEDE